MAAKITEGQREILIISCYCPPNGDINRELSKIEVVQRHRSVEVLIGGDFNARNQIWGTQTTDERGERVLEVIVTNALTLLNNKDSPPTFRTSRARRWIDLSIGNAVLARDIKEWKVLKTFNNSDQRYIRTIIENVKVEVVYGLTLRGEARMIDEIVNDVWFEEVQNGIGTAAERENVINTFYNKLKILRAKYSKKKKPLEQKPNPWWNMELYIERKRVREYRRRYQKARGDMRENYKKEYYKEHECYNNMTELAKK
ncbi:hypothetical protein HPB48_018321 [Haemaphysalis longicornis]|uniref:Endonuclease/exonuclease/phosphatase domain-containing protein n=1 Tax=Haemaphysalis longicornis TaxID=44386 RepID=A0A9J6GSY9_HAELO|nr:hypothetical protein HPB48_018321 [Haemaphysalis longicornis]